MFSFVDKFDHLGVGSIRSHYCFADCAAEPDQVKQSASLGGLGGRGTQESGPLEPKFFDMAATHLYEIRPRKDRRGVDLICDALPFGALWYAGLEAIGNAIDYAKFYSRSHDAVIRVFDEAGNAIETQEHSGDFHEP
jgi:hypothetical protein